MLRYLDATVLLARLRMHRLPSSPPTHRCRGKPGPYPVGTLFLSSYRLLTLSPHSLFQALRALERVAAGLPGGFSRARIGPFGLRGDACGRCRSRRKRIAKPATPRPALRPLETAHGQRCRTRRHLRGLPRTEHPPQPAGGLRRRIIGAVGTTRRRSARRRTGCGCSTPTAHDAQDSRWLQDSADSVAWAAHGMPESPRDISRPG